MQRRFYFDTSIWLDFFEDGKSLEVLAGASKKRIKCDVKMRDFVPGYGIINYLGRFSERFMQTKNCVPDGIYLTGLFAWNVLTGYVSYNLMN